MKKLMILICAISLVATVAAAEVLWDQSQIDYGYSVWDSESGCGFGGATVYQASDIHVWDEVTVEQITTYYTMMSGPDLESVTHCYLYIAPKTGSMPVDGVDEIDTAPLVPVTIAAVDPGDGGEWSYVVTASGLSVQLVPGEYWVVLSPANYLTGPQGPNFHRATTNHYGDDVATIEYCGMFPPAWGNWHAGRDVSLLIEGTINVVQTESSSLSEVKSLFR